jgi:hypothetical protein
MEFAHSANTRKKTNSSILHMPIRANNMEHDMDKVRNDFGEQDIDNTKLETSNKTIILGSSNVNSTLRQIPNWFILSTKWHIWKAQTSIKYEANKITAHHTVQATLNEIKLILHIIQSRTNKDVTNE